MSEHTPLIQNSVKKNANLRTSWCRYVTVEPAVFFFFFSITFTGAVFDNEVLYRTCLITLDLDNSSCRSVGASNGTANTQLESLVQLSAAKVIMVASLLRAIPPAVSSLFLGSWSDTNGRKPIIILSLTGWLLKYTIQLFIILWAPNCSPWWLALAYIPLAFSGGECVLTSCLYSYITDIIQEDNRAVRMSTMEASMSFGLLLGTISAAPVFNTFGSATVFAVAAISIALGIIYVQTAISESISDIPKKQFRLQYLFDLALVTELFKACFKSREGYSRIIMWALSLSLAAIIIPLVGENIITYLFVRQKFHWTLTDFSRFDSVSIIMQIVGTGIGVYVLKTLLGLSEDILALLSLITLILNSFIKAWASVGWHMYLAAAFVLFGGIYIPMTRSILSKLVSVNDVGKIHAFTSFMQSLSPLVAAPIYTSVYTTTLYTFPGEFFLYSAGFYTVIMITFSIIYVYQRRNGI